MSSNVSITAPFVPRFFHQDSATLSTSYAEVLARSSVPEKRVNLVLQNQDSALAIYIRLSSTSESNTSGGLLLAAGASLSLDSYKGAVSAMAPSGAPVLHIAYATI
jgi:hypothetical protein